MVQILFALLLPLTGALLPAGGLCLDSSVLAKGKRVIHLDLGGCPGAIPSPIVLVVLPGAPVPPAPQDAEGWFRLGLAEFFRPEGDTLPRAVDAFAHAAAAQESSLRHLAMYHLAWTHFRLDAHAEAAEELSRLLDLYDQPGGRPPDNLRDQALALLAATLADQPFGGSERVAAFFAKLASRAWSRNAQRWLADLHLDLTMYDDAIRFYRSLLDADPFDPAAPSMRAGIVRAFEGLRRFEEARAERQVLESVLAGGSVWWTRNRWNVYAIIDAARVLAEMKAGRPRPIPTVPVCSPSIVMHRIDPLRAALASCASGPGKLVLHLIFGPDGRAQSIRVDGPSETGECARRAAQEWSIGKLGEECVCSLTVFLAGTG